MKMVRFTALEQKTFSSLGEDLLLDLRGVFFITTGHSQINFQQLIID